MAANYGSTNCLHATTSTRAGDDQTPSSSIRPTTSIDENFPSPSLTFTSSNENSLTTVSDSDNPFREDMLRNTIPVVRDVLHGAARGLDAYMPQGKATVKSATQLDARGSSFNDVGRDQHYHINVTVCPHTNSNTTHSRGEIPNILDVDPESDGVSSLLERAINLVKNAKTYIVTIISAVIAQFGP